MLKILQFLKVQILDDKHLLFSLITLVVLMAHLRFQAWRLQTFNNFDSKDGISPLILAKKGFANCKNNIINCVYCKLSISGQFEISSEEDLERYHRIKSPTCSIITGINCTNIPIKETDVDFDTIMLELQNPAFKFKDINLMHQEKFSRTAVANINVAISVKEGTTIRKPKRVEFALKSRRDESFFMWSPGCLVSSEELSESGFYATGNGDEARCFYCGIGLHKWESMDDTWVQHILHGPKCGYLQLRLGRHIIHIVKNLNQNNSNVTMAIVMEKLGITSKSLLLDQMQEELKRDPAVKLLVEFGYQQSDVIEIAEALKLEGDEFNSISLLERLIQEQRICSRTSLNISNDLNNPESQDSIRQLIDKNADLRKQISCKICWSKQVGVVFQHCGHAVSCTECVSALETCPVCRASISHFQKFNIPSK